MNVNTVICKLVCKQKMIPTNPKICQISHEKVLVLMNCLSAVLFPWHPSPSLSVAMFPPGVRIASQLPERERGTNRNNDVNMS